VSAEATDHFQVSELKEANTKAQRELATKAIEVQEKQEQIKKLEEEFGLEGSTVRTIVQGIGAPIASTGVSRAAEGVEGGLEQVPTMEKTILGALSVKEFKELFVGEGKIEDFTHPHARELAGYLMEAQPVPDRLQSLAREAEFVVESQSQNDGEKVNSFTNLQKTFYTFRLLSLKTALQNITPLMRQAERSGNVDALRELQRQFAHFSATRLELERKIQDL
ncbi:MAG: hypothetical protein JNK33_05650, partial [Candidatus Doudnabacteria bacterium]|nr:hypothetical protein [Candidatus Doudnabacteria bacterium]